MLRGGGRVVFDTLRSGVKKKDKLSPQYMLMYSLHITRRLQLKLLRNEKISFMRAFLHVFQESQSVL